MSGDPQHTPYDAQGLGAFAVCVFLNFFLTSLSVGKTCIFLCIILV